MAKLSVTVDTEADAISVSVDGVEIQNVCSVSVYVSPADYDNYGAPDPHFTVTTCERNQSYRREEYISASGADAVRAYLAKELAR